MRTTTARAVEPVVTPKAAPPAPDVELPPRDTQLTSWHVLAIALPITFSNATTPLIGFVDTVIIGQLGEAHLIGAVAVASNIFSLVFWAFGFLRMGTTGLTAQAAGAQNASEIAANAYRPLVIAAVIGVALIVLRWPIADLAFWLAGASAAVEAEARTYFDIRILAAPAALANYAILGWFIGLGRAGMAFWLQIVLNSLNIALSVAFVMALGWGVAGVAAGAAIAEAVAVILGLVCVGRELKRRNAAARFAQTLDREKLGQLFAVNADIAIRTFCLLVVFFFFTSQGARAGDLTLAANAILQSVTSITAYLLDGFAYAAETLVGQAIGAQQRKRFIDAVRLSTIWAVLVSALVSLFLWAFGETIVLAMTTNGAVEMESLRYLWWAILTPIVGVWCFQLDGIFIGATRTADMRNMMIASVAVFFVSWALLTPVFGNHGLWAALFVFYVTRAASLAWKLPRLIAAAYPPQSSAA